MLNGFLAWTRCDILIERHDKKQLIALAAMAKEKDSLHRVMGISEKYFTEISDKLRVGNVLLRRKIESEGYVITLTITLTIRRDLRNMPFKASNQKKHVGRKFEDVCTIAVLRGTYDRTGSQVV